MEAGWGEALLGVNDRLNELKPTWPCTGRGGGGRDVLRLVPQSVLATPPFSSYLSDSNNRTAELQAKALRRLVAYMHERGSRVCDQSATRDECLMARQLESNWGPTTRCSPPCCGAHPHIFDDLASSASSK